ncbi:TetR/AcrR family transcriptional regulator [Chitinophaga sp.]|uniref:TetR/AcrR family transcriptional regulator n=1 Tax=Chitinophaga sp. TaxID=1869181 RepID=UPI0026192447|nr:TetR/AcrR family transcriptional regulator [uncultured Chitinophaga sp.]
MRPRDENKICLLHKKAIEMIVHEGLDGFGVNKLARAAGVSPATLYIYFKDREDLIIQVTLRVTQTMLEESLRDFDPDMHFEEGLRKQWHNRASHFTRNPLDVEFIEKMRYSHLYNKVSVQVYASFKDVMGKFVRNAIERKELIELPFEVYWSVAFAPLYQLIKFHTQEKTFGHQPFKLTDESMELALQLVLKALKPA